MVIVENLRNHKEPFIIVCYFKTLNLISVCFNKYAFVICVLNTHHTSILNSLTNWQTLKQPPKPIPFYIMRKSTFFPHLPKPFSVKTKCKTKKTLTLYLYGKVLHCKVTAMKIKLGKFRKIHGVFILNLK